MAAVLFYDDRGGFGPTFNATHAVGGAEIHLVQIAGYLAACGHDVTAATLAGASEENRVAYRPTTDLPSTVDVAIVVGCASLPRVHAGKTLAFQVVDPRPHPQMFDHLRGHATLVCVSEWHASLFRDLGHEAVVVPVPIPDEWYTPDPSVRRVAQFGCFSSWNKGAEQTIAAWDDAWGSLAVGSPYSHPGLVAHRPGVTWLGTLRPRERWITAMRSVCAIARICTIGETFGVVDVAARAMGMHCYTLCTGDVGSLREVGARPFTDAAEWRDAIRQRAPHPGGDAERFRASRVLSSWLGLVA